MKKIWTFLFGLFVFLSIPSFAQAASGTITVSSSPTSVIVGNRVTVTVTIKSSVALGSWQMDLNYDKNYLSLTSSTAESGGTSMANSNPGNKQKTSQSYTFTFKTLKKGNTKISIDSYEAYAYSDQSEINLTSSSKTIRIMTQSEMEATYSTNAYLKSLTVSGLTLNPAFNKETLEYAVEVENAVTKVSITGTKADNSASVSGNGEFELAEGNNKFEIIVTAQRGNTLTYTLNIYRKELNPIAISYEGENYTIIRKVENMPTRDNFMLSTITYQEAEIPVLVSETLNYTLIGVTNAQGEVFTLIYDDGITGIYREIKSNSLTISPKKLPKGENFNNYDIYHLTISNTEVDGYKITANSSKVIFYGLNAENGEEDYYLYDIDTNTITPYSREVEDFYQDKLTKYKYVIYGLCGFIVILFFIIIVRKPHKNPRSEFDFYADEPKKTASKSSKKKVSTVEQAEPVEELPEIKLIYDDKAPSKKPAKKK